ncbi:MAG: GGDEF domain-containing protein [Oscillospiraceae bacterium]|nr:GGDEF domain-containing protein [Oscillospiraceae bacterium]
MARRSARNARGKRNTMNRKRRKDPGIRKISRLYLLMGIIYVVFIAFNMIVENLVYVNTRDQYDANLESVNQVAQIRKEFSKINQNILVLASVDVKPQKEALLQQIENGLVTLGEQEATFFELVGDSSENATRRFRHVVYALKVYENKINEIKGNLLEMNSEEAVAIYVQELNPLWMVANEMLGAVTEITSREAAMKRVKIAMNHGIAQGSLVVMVVILIITLILFADRQIKTLIEVQNQTRELNEASARLTKSRKKLLDSAMTNILTGMKNRYALDENLSQLINNAQFNIAVFDVDNFRNINDMYGYEVGDEYLATIAERLKDEYSDYAEMYNITGNEFCMIFYEHVTDTQAQQLAEQIRIGIGQPTMVAGSLVLQAPVSASLYHYLPSDNLDVNTLLMRMDSALHAAKRDGGNRMYQIQ